MDEARGKRSPQRRHGGSLLVAELSNGNALAVDNDFDVDRASGLEAHPVDSNPQHGVRLATGERNSELRSPSVSPDADDIRVSPALSEALEVVEIGELDPPIGRNVQAAGTRPTSSAPIELAAHQV